MLILRLTSVNNRLTFDNNCNILVAGCEHFWYGFVIGQNVY